jgi:hypothetical protein
MRESRKLRKARKSGKVEDIATAINKLQDEIIRCYKRGDFKMGVEGVRELAEIWKSSGSTQQSFWEICMWMENEAVEATGDELIRTHIRSEMQQSKKIQILLH